MEDQEAFYKNSKDGLFAYLLRMTGDYHLASDLVQESFTRYIRHYGKNSNTNRSLLYTIAKNAAMDAFRLPKYSHLNPDFHVDNRSNPEQQLNERQSYDRILSAVKQLPPIERELLALLIGADLSYRKIGKKLKLSEANVKVKVHRARIKLKEILAKEEK